MERLRDLVEYLDRVGMKNTSRELGDLVEDVKAQRRESIPRAAYERKKAGWLDHIEECEEALARRNGRIAELRRERDKLRDEAAWAESLSEILDEWADLLGFPEQKGDPGKITARVGAVLDGTWRRLMPEGMEWPRFEDGEPVRLGEHWQQDEYDWSITSIDSIEFAEDGVRFENEYADAFYRYGERVKRPAPKVLDADGAEIREKLDVWWICEGDERGVHAERLRVETICPNGLIECSPYNGGTWVYPEPSELYVNKPVPSSDGRPLREGETVLGVDSGTRYTVEKVTDGFIPIKCRSEMGTTVSLFPLQLTHERPPVLASDGEPLEVGQTVYHIADGKEYTVEELFKAGAMVTHDGITGGRCRAEYLTHHRPVIAADGKPLREGETVWSVSGLTEYRVLRFENGLVYVENSRNKFVCSYREPKELTHDGQDSFARIWDDAFNGLITWQEMERRARALAERGQ